MDRFVSLFIHPVDSKGRVSLPANFRSVLAKDGFEGLYVSPSLDFPALDCGGNRLLEEVDRIKAGFPLGSYEHDLLALGSEGESEIVHVDKEGRFVLTERMKVFLGQPDRIAFTGLGHKFQMWRPELREEFAAKARALRASMRGGPLPPPPGNSG